MWTIKKRNRERKREKRRKYSKSWIEKHYEQSEVGRNKFRKCEAKTGIGRKRLSANSLIDERKYCRVLLIRPKRKKILSIH